VVAAGDAGSKLLGTLADATHAAVADALPQVRSWVVDGRLAYFRSEVHPGGIANPADPDFHGALIQKMSWNLGYCSGCHGDDFKGGNAKASCLTCHELGPTSCNTCHGMPPATGAHAAHAFDCSECHPKPATWDAPGHIGTKAVIQFGPLASKGTTPSYDGASCSSVYCHGSAQPKWNGGAAEAACGTCHADPPVTHTGVASATDWPSSSASCAQCHSASSHVDGKLQLGDASGSCTGCHGAPPATGAHLAHTTASVFSAAIACSACHVVPATVNDPGHIQFAPARVSFSGVSAADGASPAWNGTTCSSTYCHGNGATLAGDTGAQLRTPAWGGTDHVQCGSCHGLPPTSPNHDGVTSITQCVKCHASTVDAAGHIVFADDGTTTHMNGVADVGR